MRRFSQYLILALFLINISSVNLLAQTTIKSEVDTSQTSADSSLQGFRGLVDPFLDFEIGVAAKQAQLLSNIGYEIINPIGYNSELQNTMEEMRNKIQSEIFIKCPLIYSHLYTKIVNTNKYSPQESEIKQQLGIPYANSLFIVVSFLPAWDTTSINGLKNARKADSIAFNCKISLQSKDIFTSGISRTEMEEVMNSVIKSQSYKKIKNATNDVNLAIYEGLLWLAEKYNYKTSDDPSNIEKVVFNTSKALNYGYDAYNKDLAGNYESTTIKGKHYTVPWKSIGNTNNDIIIATVKKKNPARPVTDTLKFITESGVPYNNVTQLSDTTYKITIPPVGSESEFVLLSNYVYSDSSANQISVTTGQVNISGYLNQKMHVVIIPVGDALANFFAPELQKELNDIYKQAVTSWSVSIDDKLKVKGIDINNFDDGNTKMLSNYTAEMNAVIKTYKKQNGNIDKNTSYLFLVNQAKSGTGKCGFMPLKRQFGFIFLNSTCKNDINRTIAHELGHGPFRLYHTFSGNSKYFRPEGSTDNLMDYGDGSKLNKFEWSLIHNPQAMIGLLQDEEEGAMETTENPEFVIKALKYLREGYLNPPNDKHLNIYELGTLRNYFGNIDLGDGVERYIKVATGKDAWANKKIIINIDDLREGIGNTELNEQKMFFINTDRIDKEHGLEIHCKRSSINTVKDYIQGKEINFIHKKETIINDKLTYNYTLSRYESDDGLALDIDDFYKIIKEDCQIEGGEFVYQPKNEDIMNARNGVRAAKLAGDPLLDLVKESSKIYLPIQMAAAVIDLSKIEGGASPLTMLPIIGNCVEPLEYFAGWDNLDKDYEWFEAKLDYRKMQKFNETYGNIYNVGFIYTDYDIFKEIDKNIFIISNEYSPTNRPKMISIYDNPNLEFVYWGYLSIDGSMIIKGRLKYY